jgi:hypothetical protein
MKPHFIREKSLNEGQHRHQELQKPVEEINLAG